MVLSTFHVISREQKNVMVCVAQVYDRCVSDIIAVVSLNKDFDYCNITSDSMTHIMLFNIQQ